MSPKKPKKSAKEKPVQVIPGASKEKHKTETRVFARNIHESFCIQPGCQFMGEHAVQNVCHTLTTMNDSDDWSYIDVIIESGDKYVENLRKHVGNRSTKAVYIKRLESEIACAWIQVTSTLDELVRLRGRVAVLEKAKSKSVAKKGKKA